jgi:GAF domain-containing protein
MAMNSTGEQHNDLSQRLVKLLESIEAGGNAVLPQSNDDLLKSIVETAARIFNAGAASILLVNDKEGVLVFRVAYGASDHNLVGTKFPLDKGIAGYVAMTGQPLAISNVRQDPRFNQDFAKSTGYIPGSILAVPLLSAERVIGVMEILDKINASSFDVQDMELLSMFARQAAIAIDQSQQVDLVNGALILGLKRLVANESLSSSDELMSVLDQVSEDATSYDLLALSDLFNEISKIGTLERKTCIQILKVFAEYSRTTHRTRP